MNFGYNSRLERDFGRWVDEGLVDEASAAAMLADARSRKGGYSFASVIVFLGVVSLALGAMTFVAANWEAIPRPAKVAMAVIAIWAMLAASAYAFRRERPVLADALAMLAAALFGAGIMLVGQLYHLQGRAPDAVLLWTGGAGLACLMLASRGSLWLAIVLATVWLGMDAAPEFGNDPAVNRWFPVVWLALAALAWWLHSRAAAHLLAIAAIAWLAVSIAIVASQEESLTAAIGVYGGLFLLVGASLLAFRFGGRVRDVAGLALFYSLVCIAGLTGGWIAVRVFDTADATREELIGPLALPVLAILLAVAVAMAFYGWARARARLYDLVLCALWIAVVLFAISPWGWEIPFLVEAFALALSIWFIRMGGRQDMPVVTRIGFIAFVLVMGLLYFRTAGTLLGTSGFYLGAGLVLLLGALLGSRLLPGSGEREEAAS